MATPKGNMMAYQALKPLPELKIADLANDIITTFEKETQAKEQARLKRLQDERKSAEEYFKTLNVNSYSTISKLSDQTERLYKDTADYIGNLRLMATRDPLNRGEYERLANKAQTNHEAMKSMFGDENFKKKAEEKLQAYASGEYFMEGDEKERMEMISNGMVRMELDRTTGEYKFAIAKNASEPLGEKTKWYSAGEVKDMFTSDPALNLLDATNSNKGNTLYKKFGDIADSFIHEYSTNNDGNITKSGKQFAKERAGNWFESAYGEFQAGAVPEELKQFSKRVLKKEIETAEDYANTKEEVLKYIESIVPTELNRDTKYMKSQIEGIELENRHKRALINNVGKSGATNETSGGAFVKNNNVVIQTQDKNGNVIGVGAMPMRTIALGKVKGQPSTNTNIGTNTYIDNQGNVKQAYYLGSPAGDGTVVYKRVTGDAISSFLTKSGYNPLQGQDWLTKPVAFNNTQEAVPSLGNNYKPKKINNPLYMKVKINQKGQEMPEDDNFNSFNFAPKY